MLLKCNCRKDGKNTATGIVENPLCWRAIVNGRYCNGRINDTSGGMVRSIEVFDGHRVSEDQVFAPEREITQSMMRSRCDCRSLDTEARSGELLAVLSVVGTWSCANSGAKNWRQSRGNDWEQVLEGLG